MATRPKNPRVLLAEAVIAQLRIEAADARHRCDDDVPSVPDGSSARGPVHEENR